MIFRGGGGSGPPAPPPPLDPLMIRLLPSANWTVSILSHTEWWYKKHHLKTNIEMKQTATDNSPGNCWHVARRTHDHRAIALGLPQDDRPMSIRFYGPCKGIVRRPCGLLTTIARVYDARKSVRWSQGLPVEAVRKRWFGHRTGIVYSS